MDKATIPVKVGQLVDVTIDDIVAGGEALGKLGGYAVFVPFGAPGDQLRVKIISAKTGYARGLIDAIREPGGERVKAPCPVYGVCGGCHLQHIAYSGQVTAKERLVSEALRRIGKIETEILPIKTMDDPWNYRNKAHWALSQQIDKLEIGLYEARSHRVVTPNVCAIQHPLLNLVLDFLRKELPTFDLRVYDEAKDKGWLRSAFAKVAHATDELMVGLVATTDHFPQREDWVQALTHQFPGITSIVLNVNPRRTNVLMGDRTEVLHGRDHLVEEIGGLRFRLSAKSFFQVNPLQTRSLYQQVSEFAGLTGEERVVDAYCGTGTIALALAAAAGEVWGIESEPSAVADAEVNAKLNGLDHVQFLLGRVEERLPKMVKEGLSPDVVVLDPPRKGCDPAVIDAIVQAAPRRVVYVSCNPATLARDLGLFAAQGYITQQVQPVDMFPQTAHVEAVALVSR